ncbi:MAG: helix-turn-helix transcriptional regulator [Vampirovibrionales bacterium]|nr:helix-turn-helix transcriptional regulator [Vampirovibrionales bacterium]
MAQVATRLGVHRSQVLRIERGEAVPSPKLIERICIETGGHVRPEDFFDLPAIPAGDAA